MGTFDAGLLTRSSVNIPKATIDAVGGGGEGLVAAGKTLVEIGDGLAVQKQRIAKRDDAIKNVIAVEQFRDFIDNEEKTRGTGTNLADPAGVAQHTLAIKEHGNKILDDYTGTSLGRAALVQQMERWRSESSRRFSGVVIEAGRTAINNSMDAEFGSIVESSVVSGDIQFGFNQLDEMVARNEGTTTPEQEAARMTGGRQTLVTAVFESVMQNRDIDSARDILSIEGLSEFMPPADLTKMRGDIIKVEREAEKGRIEAQQTLDEFRVIMNLGPDEKISQKDLEILAGIRSPRDETTRTEYLTDVGNAILEHTGKKMTDEQALRALKVFDEESPRSYNRAGSRAITTNLAQSIIEGTHSEQDAIDFVAATTVLTEPFFTLDPVSGLLVHRTGELTQTTKDALAKLGVSPTGAPIGGEPGTDGSPDQGDLTLLSDERVSVPESETLWALSKLGTGLTSTLKAGVASVPVLGEFAPSSATVQAREQLTLMSNELVDLLRLSNRGETERAEIKEETRITPTMFTTATNYRNRLIAIDNNLEKRINAALATLGGGKIGIEQRRFLLKFVSKAEVFRDNMNVPPKFKTFTEARDAELSPGADFRIVGRSEIYRAPKAPGK